VAAPGFFFEEWMSVLEETFAYNFENQSDKVSWKWGGKGVFTNKSVYEHITSGQSSASFAHIWQARLPYKIKIFTWLLEKNVVLTKDNMVKRNWLGDPSCAFCEQMETVDHLFFQCPVARCI